MFSNRWQITSDCVRKKNLAHDWGTTECVTQPSVSQMFQTHWSVSCETHGNMESMLQDRGVVCG